MAFTGLHFTCTYYRVSDSVSGYMHTSTKTKFFCGEDSAFPLSKFIEQFRSVFSRMMWCHYWQWYRKLQ